MADVRWRRRRRRRRRRRKSVSHPCNDLRMKESLLLLLLLPLIRIQDNKATIVFEYISSTLYCGTRPLPPKKLAIFCYLKNSFFLGGEKRSKIFCSRLLFLGFFCFLLFFKKKKLFACLVFFLLLLFLKQCLDSCFHFSF